MKNYLVTLDYLYNHIECEIEAKTEDEALNIFGDEIRENEGDNFLERAMLHGRFSVEQI